MPMNLNTRAHELVEQMIARADELHIAAREDSSGARIVDVGVEVAGGVEAGRRLAEVCMAGLARIDIVPAPLELWRGPAVQVVTDHPVAACMAAQYAGWRVKGDDFFAMGSGPMRAAAAVEKLFERIGHRERSDVAVGVLETRAVPPSGVIADVARRCGVEPKGLTLLVVPTASQAGSVQIAARSVETALHKLLELDFDLNRIESGYGTAPLPPVAASDVAAIGRANDALLYGGAVTLWVRGDDRSLEEIGARVPSSASKDYGRPFAEIFEAHGRDFYEVDPSLFSPAAVTFVNLDTGRVHPFGEIAADIIRESFTS